jgi:histidinol-phosphate/aromatic aminotransferase/cobyric acid decarboxylase-like protein
VVRRALARAPIHRYPDPYATAARRAFAAHAGVAADRLALGNGAVELMWTLARAVLAPGDCVLVVEPAFSEMRAAALRMGAHAVEHRTTPEADFAIDLAALDARVATLRPRLVYASSPSNPAGVCTPLAAIEDIARRHPASLFVVDLSFLSLSARHAEHGEPRDASIVWLRSLTKDHALAGLRVGAAVAPREIVVALDRERPPWSVNALAQAAVVAAISDEATRFVDDSRQRLLADRGALTGALGALDLRAHPSDTIYALVPLGPRIAATELRRRLLARHRILVRDATSFGLPHHVRVAARPAADRERFVAALREELSR